MIYTGLNNTGEIDNVYLSKRLTFSGTPPLSFPSKGYDLEDFLISGNTVQNDTPTPSDPVDVIGCGEKTENLYNSAETDWEIGILDDNGNNTGATTSHYTKNFTAVEPETSYYISGTIYIGQSSHRIYYYDASKNWISRSTVTGYYDGKFTTPANCKYVRFQMIVDLESTSDWMLNTGSTSKPYEPYGFKLPLTVNGTEYPIYLGQVKTTRRVKKLVLTGEEIDWTDVTTGGNHFFISPVLSGGAAIFIGALSTHYIPSNATGEKRPDNSIRQYIYMTTYSKISIRDDACATLTDFKTFLQQQYAAGTPVTIWYILANEETGIVNEPLMKIGDYADTVSMSQSGITIPTTKGENILTVPTTVLPSGVSVTTPSIEVAEVYGDINYQKPIYYKKRTLIGVPPLNYKALSNPLSDYLISGNTFQNGTPSPDMPVDVVGCGVRTGNLFDAEVEQGSFNGNTGEETISTSRIRSLFSSPMVAGQYTLSAVGVDYAVVYVYDTNNTSGFKRGESIVTWTPLPVTFALTTSRYVRFCFRKSDDSVISPSDISNIMLNIGSTAKPYQPYGFKLPPAVNGTEYPIYLGQVPTTRRIKKLVFDGTESWNYRTGEPSSTFFIEFIGAHFINNSALCTHYLNQDSGRFNELADKHVLILFANDGTKSYIGLRDSSFTSGHISELKEYLAAQYAAGTPVVVWYVLATPTTSIVNEPLHKIGDYADTISMAQAGVTIPTVAGSNVLDMTSTVKPSAVSITGNIKPTGYGQLLDVNDVDIQDKNGTPIFIRG